MLKYAGYLMALIALIIVGIITVTNPRPHDEADIASLSEQLFEFGAVRYVHGLSSDYKDTNQALFDRVLAGDVLDATESCTYRTAYWHLLQEHAKRFQFVDDDLHMAENYGLDLDNNCDAKGILGLHDMHDFSAQQNFDQLVGNLDLLQDGTGWLNAVILINEVNKNLVDLTVHFAPATHSIGVRVPDLEFSGPFAKDYDAMQDGFKMAQFSAVNSPEYWNGIDAALMSYSAIVAQAQDVIFANSSALQRRLAGRWLSLQTVAPRLDEDTCVRPRPNPIAPICS
jgi:hypothetical protein